MSWLKLTSQAFYLMEGGTDQYIDKVEIENLSDDKVGFKDFPKQWFTSKLQRPRTLIVDLEDNKIARPFCDFDFLKLFEIPISKPSFENLKKSQSIPEVFDRFFDLMGGFSNEFFQYKLEYRILPPLLTFPDRVHENKPLTFPVIDFRDDEADFSRKEPSFAEIMLWLAWKEGLTIRPFLNKFSPDPAIDRNIRVELKFIDQPLPAIATQAVSLETLENALIPKPYNIDNDDPQLFDVLDFLAIDRKIAVNIANDLTDRRARIRLLGDVTFTEIMDKLASTLNLKWDWQGSNSAFLSQN